MHGIQQEKVKGEFVVFCSLVHLCQIYDMLRVDLYFMFTLESIFMAGLIRRRLKVDPLCG
jgi:hypothetical protein